jgi:hypothetical protein
MMFTRPISHTQTTHQQHGILRASSPGFHLPNVRAMRDPSTGYMTTITASGPATFER